MIVTCLKPGSGKESQGTSPTKKEVHLKQSTVVALGVGMVALGILSIPSVLYNKALDVITPR